ncbi:hypothetical protein ASD79_10960 [Caulobacter sp. Root655]|nr:hypothetical protein ASD79_10960 [Caulobacter sp. Root655]
MRHFGLEEQALAVARAQAAMWRGVVARFEHLKATEGLRQADLAAALGVSRPQIHEWLSNSHNMTLKASGRLLLAMDAHAQVEIQAGRDVDAEPAAPEVVEVVSRSGVKLTAGLIPLSGRMALTNNGEKDLFFRLDRGG